MQVGGGGGGAFKEGMLERKARARQTLRYFRRPRHFLTSADIVQVTKDSPRPGETWYATPTKARELTDLPGWFYASGNGAN